MTEFNLSYKRQDLINQARKDIVDEIFDFQDFIENIETLELEFIRLLKENLRNWDKIDEGYFLEVIDKLAGDKLK